MVMAPHVRPAAKLVALASLLALALVGALPAGAVDPVVTQGAVNYLDSQQLAGTMPASGSGAWDSDPAFEFVTSEAVLAVAEGGQTGTAWSTSSALTAVQGMQNAQGTHALPFLDLAAGGSLSPGKAAKLILLLAEPLGLDPTSFDPAGNGGPVNLVTAMGSGNADGSFGPAGAFNQTLFAALAHQLVNGSVPAQTVQYIGSKQKPANGGWAFDADTGSVTEADVDTTSFAIQALIAGGVAPTDPAVRNGLAFIASQQNPDGSWSAFGNVSAESTSRAILAIAAAGYDPNSSCWRDTVLPASAGSLYGAPDDALVALQGADGSIAGPGSFSPAFSTAQAVQGLERQWLPIETASGQPCPAGPGGGAPPDGSIPGGVPVGDQVGAPAGAPAEAVVSTPRFTG
jgi:Prenyltransferase and squalene oxidase repeat